VTRRRPRTRPRRHQRAKWDMTPQRSAPSVDSMLFSRTPCSNITDVNEYSRKTLTAPPGRVPPRYRRTDSVTKATAQKRWPRRSATRISTGAGRDLIPRRRSRIRGGVSRNAGSVRAAARRSATRGSGEIDGVRRRSRRRFDYPQLWSDEAGRADERADELGRVERSRMGKAPAVVNGHALVQPTMRSGRRFPVLSVCGTVTMPTRIQPRRHRGRLLRGVGPAALTAAGRRRALPREQPHPPTISPGLSKPLSRSTSGPLWFPVAGQRLPITVSRSWARGDAGRAIAAGGWSEVVLQPGRRRVRNRRYCCGEYNRRFGPANSDKAGCRDGASTSVLASPSRIGRTSTGQRVLRGGRPNDVNGCFAGGRRLARGWKRDGAALVRDDGFHPSPLGRTSPRW